jgi:hypothetical protein
MKVESGTDWIVCTRAGLPLQSFARPEDCARWLNGRANPTNFQVRCVTRLVTEVPNLDIWIPAILGEYDLPPAPPPTLPESLLSER